MSDMVLLVNYKVNSERRKMAKSKVCAVGQTGHRSLKLCSLSLELK